MKESLKYRMILPSTSQESVIFPHIKDTETLQLEIFKKHIICMAYSRKMKQNSKQWTYTHGENKASFYI